VSQTVYWPSSYRALRCVISLGIRQEKKAKAGKRESVSLDGAKRRGKGRQNGEAAGRISKQCQIHHKECKAEGSLWVIATQEEPALFIL